MHRTTGEIAKGSLGYASAPNPEYFFFSSWPHPALLSSVLASGRSLKAESSQGQEKPFVPTQGGCPCYVSTPPFWELVGNRSWKYPLDAQILSTAWALLLVPPELVCPW